MDTRSKVIRSFFLAALLMLLAAACSACGGESSDMTADPSRGIYPIYGINSDGCMLKKDTVTVTNTEPQAIADELLRDLMGEGGGSSSQGIFPKEVRVNGTGLNDGTYGIDFSKEYLTMDRNREVLCRAALAKTITQVEGIQLVRVTCTGQPLTDASGNVIGAFSGSDFVESISNVNSFEHVELRLYFASADGTSLVPETRQVVHNMNTSMEKLDVEQLLAGSQTGLSPVLPKGTQILGVSNSDGICYVNFDSSFLTGELTTSENLTIYAIVDSLTELSSLSRVQITVNGQADVPFHSISLAEPFERDESYIVKAE